MVSPNPQQQATILENNALMSREEFSNELAPTAAAAEKQFEIQSAIIIAKRFPRNEDQAFQKLMKACQRTSFAEDAEYSFPRGDARVNGPSVQLAREAARNWTNIRYGLSITRDDEGSRQIQGWAWDLETNTKVTAEDDFAKLIYRKPNPKKNIAGGWVRPDERDLRELTNRRGAILVRNCILQVLPKDYIEDAQEMSKQTLRSSAAKDPDSARKKLILAFSELNVTPEMLEQYLGHPLSQCSPAELTDLRGIYKSISDGNSKWAEYVASSDTNGNGDDAGQSKSDRLAEQLRQQQQTNAATQATNTAPAASADAVVEKCGNCGATQLDSELISSPDGVRCKGGCNGSSPEPSSEASPKSEAAASSDFQDVFGQHDDDEPTLPLETNAPLKIGGVTFPANPKCTSLADKATVEQHEMMIEQCARIGVKLSDELKKWVKLDFDDLNKEAAFFFIEFLKGRKSKGEK